MDINQKIIMITGAAQGLGLAFGRELAKAGAQLILVDLDQIKLQQAASQLAALGSFEPATYVCNVAKEEEVVGLFGKIKARFGKLHGLINNAGITRDGLLVKQNAEGIHAMESKIWQQVIDVNLTGVFLCGREAASLMVESQTKGVIVNISSISKDGNMGQSNYSAAKAGVASMSVTWAKELSRHGIRVAAIAPGFVATEMVAAIREDVLAKITRQIPLGRLAEPSEIAHAARFILENDYFTGRVLSLDGGLRI